MQMMIDVDVSQLDGIVRAWLKDTLETVEGNAAAQYVHPDDANIYKKDIEAIKWVLEYIGDGK
jgi:hypothetical protein